MLWKFLEPCSLFISCLRESAETVETLLDIEHLLTGSYFKQVDYLLCQSTGQDNPYPLFVDYPQNIELFVTGIVFAEALFMTFLVAVTLFNYMTKDDDVSEKLTSSPLYSSTVASKRHTNQLDAMEPSPC